MSYVRVACRVHAATHNACDTILMFKRGRGCLLFSDSPNRTCRNLQPNKRRGYYTRTTTDDYTLSGIVENYIRYRAEQTAVGCVRACTGMRIHTHMFFTLSCLSDHGRLSIAFSCTTAAAAVATLYYYIPVCTL